MPKVAPTRSDVSDLSGATETLGDLKNILEWLSLIVTIGLAGAAVNKALEAAANLLPTLVGLTFSSVGKGICEMTYRSGTKGNCCCIIPYHVTGCFDGRKKEAKDCRRIGWVLMVIGFVTDAIALLVLVLGPGNE